MLGEFECGSCDVCQKVDIIYSVDITTIAKSFITILMEINENVLTYLNENTAETFLSGVITGEILTMGLNKNSNFGIAIQYPKQILNRFILSLLMKCYIEEYAENYFGIIQYKYIVTENGKKFLDDPTSQVNYFFSFYIKYE